jgi:hypothetical protein
MPLLRLQISGLYEFRDHLVSGSRVISESPAVLSNLRIASSSPIFEHLNAIWKNVFLSYVVAFHPAASQDPTQVFLSNQLREHSSGGTIELVIVHPIHWDDPRLYFSELRASGIMLR